MPDLRQKEKKSFNLLSKPVVDNGKASRQIHGNRLPDVMRDDFFPALPGFELLKSPRASAGQRPFISTPLLLNSPHSGRDYPDCLLKASRLDGFALRRSEDAYVDELFTASLQHGVEMLRVLFPRAFLDVNREPYELDPKMFSGKLPPFANTRSVRVAGGLGVIPRIVADREDIYDRPLLVDDALKRIETYHKPYHHKLRNLLQDMRRQHGVAVLLDCHSMPSCARGRFDKPRADIVLGDRYGTSCAPGLVDLAQAALERIGFSVARNKPYAGGFITEHYGAPAQGIHVFQIEINRALYLNEKTLEKLDGFDELARKLSQLVAVLLQHLDNVLDERPVAAE